MGATTFYTVGRGKTPSAAFESARSEAAYEYGHGGYTGTIAEKDSYVTVELPAGVSVRDFLDAMPAHWYGEQLPAWAKGFRQFKRLADTYDDKWGPALCFPLGDGQYAFAGFASE